MPYTQDNIISSGRPPLLWSDINAAFNTINQNFVELYATIGGGSIVDFSNLSTNVTPSVTETYDLGSSTKRWKDLYLGGSSLYLGDAIITATGTAVNLPAGSTIAGSVLDNEYFRTIAVAGQSNIVADAGGDDTLTIVAGNSGITLTTNASTDTLTITNSGVTNAVAGTGISVSSATGSVTYTNSGVTSILAGFGMSVNQATGTVTVTNEGLAGLDPGIGITLSPRDPITGRVTVTNSQPNVPQNVFNTIAVPTQTDVVADSTTDTLTLEVSGNGLSITTNASTDTITFANTGVHSLAVGNGLTASAGTGSINLTLDATLLRNIVGDITGSVFADDSSILVDAVSNYIYGNVSATTLRTAETKISLGASAGETGQGTNGIAIGALSGQTNQGVQSVAIGANSGNSNQGLQSVALGNLAGALNQGQRAVAIGSLAGSNGQGDYAVALGNFAGGTNQPANSIIINASGVGLNGSAAGLYIDPIRSTTSAARPVVYDTGTKELFYTSTLEFINSTISTTDSSGLVVDVQTTFNTDVVFENDIIIAERLTVKGSRVINLAELKSVVAVSADFADFKTRIAALS